VPVTFVRDLTRASLLSLPLLFASPAARGAETATAQCASAYEKAQLLRQRGKLVAARESAAVCARDACPEVARRDCARWTEELGREVPSVVVVVRDDADHDVVAQRLLVDGAPRVEVASGRAFELDPGSHVVRVERANAPPAEQTVIVYQGERDRIVRITVPSPPGVAPAPVATAVAPAPSSPSAPATSGVSRARPSYVAAGIVGGLSLASLATSAYLGLTGRQQLSDLRSSCAPTCTDAQVDPVRTRLLASDVTLGVGIVGAAIATYLFVETASERSSAPTAQLEIAPVRSGAVAFLGARF